ncbi:vWA domain-containing protein [Teichococcus oryzae]|uniref:VWA domain-containing protein n=1 Tax=Teichococcus oryzae TaxID=1608942 RepID=A0A5B2TGK3_9PROT|nr:VWA domain-containing protein [Pseudoroseomonas oryzae]KAA2213233.1 VWA domain-containing protein [Pseudoroseomonas oryzae]
MAQLPARPASGAVATFLDQLGRMPAVHAGTRRLARLVFAIDATASRQPSWDRACHLQAEMFTAAAAHGGLAIQLAYYRGHGEFAATPFLTDGGDLKRRMTGLACLGGRTQIGKVLSHALRETARDRVAALVFVGDAVEEPPDPLCHSAGELGLRGTPVFAFQEGHDATAREVLRQVAKLSGGAHHALDEGSAGTLRDLLRAVAVYAAGGHAALSRLPGAAARGLVAQLPPPGRS